jgi:hypothetical protein
VWARAGRGDQKVGIARSNARAGRDGQSADVRAASNGRFAWASGGILRDRLLHRARLARLLAARRRRIERCAALIAAPYPEKRVALCTVVAPRAAEQARGGNSPHGPMLCARFAKKKRRQSFPRTLNMGCYQTEFFLVALWRVFSPGRTYTHFTLSRSMPIHRDSDSATTEWHCLALPTYSVQTQVPNLVSSPFWLHRDPHRLVRRGP